MKEESIMKFNSYYFDVILNDNELTKEEIVNYINRGKIVISTGDIMKIVDDETDEEYVGTITIITDDLLLFDCYDESGKIYHEEEITIELYLDYLKNKN